MFLRCHYVPALSQCNSRYTRQKQDFWEQNSSQWPLACFYPPIQRHGFLAAVGHISSAPGSHIWQYMALYFRSLGRCRRGFWQKLSPRSGRRMQERIRRSEWRGQASELGCYSSAASGSGVLGQFFHLPELQLPHLKHEAIIMPTS